MAEVLISVTRKDIALAARLAAEGASLNSIAENALIDAFRRTLRPVWFAGILNHGCLIAWVGEDGIMHAVEVTKQLERFLGERDSDFVSIAKLQLKPTTFLFDELSIPLPSAEAITIDDLEFWREKVLKKPLQRERRKRIRETEHETRQVRETRETKRA